MLEKIKIITLALSGFITYIMDEIIPVAGGGASLIFVLSKPILLFLGLVFTTIYYSFKSDKRLLKLYLYVLFMVVQIGLALLFFPYE